MSQSPSPPWNLRLFLCPTCKGFSFQEDNGKKIDCAVPSIRQWVCIVSDLIKSHVWFRGTALKAHNVVGIEVFQKVRNNFSVESRKHSEMVFIYFLAAGSVAFQFYSLVNLGPSAMIASMALKAGPVLFNSIHDMPSTLFSLIKFEIHQWALSKSCISLSNLNAAPRGSNSRQTIDDGLSSFKKMHWSRMPQLTRLFNHQERKCTRWNIMGGEGGLKTEFLIANTMF